VNGLGNIKGMGNGKRRVNKFHGRGGIFTPQILALDSIYSTSMADVVFSRARDWTARTVFINLY